MSAGLMGKYGVSVAALVVGAAALGVATLKKTPKIAYAETSVLLTEFTEGIKARKEFEEARKEWDVNLKRLNDSLMASMEKMKATYEKSSPEERRTMDQNLNKWNENLQRYTNAVKNMSQEKEKALMEPVIQKMNSYLKVWGDIHGYAMIFGTTAGGNILQADAAYNVTSPFLVDLNAHYKDLPSGEKASGSAANPAPSAPKPMSTDTAVRAAVPKDSSKTKSSAP